ncbi:MAG: hypothetical protein WCS43_12140 [Verrucomicrobiota bacterium]
MINDFSASVLIIAGTPQLLESLEAAIRSKNEISVSGMLWSQTPMLLKPESIRDSSLVVAELFREYQYGTRAEGVVLAERWAGITPFLIVAPRHWSDQIGCPGYWDVASSDSLGARVQLLVATPQIAMDNLENLKARIKPYLSIPRQH